MSGNSYRKFNFVFLSLLFSGNMIADGKIESNKLDSKIEKTEKTRVNENKSVPEHLNIKSETNKVDIKPETKLTEKSSDSSNKINKKIKVKKETLVNKDFKSMTFEELEHNRKLHAAVGSEKDIELKYTERMIAICKDQNVICKLRLEQADIQFDLGNLDKAATSYQEFIKLYPGSKDVEYANYKAILAKFDPYLSCDCDQTGTKEALKMAKEFIKNDSYAKYKDKVEDLAKRCSEKLLNCEIHLYNFYLEKGKKRKKFKAAENRLEGIKNQFFSEEKDSSLLAEMEEQLKAAKQGKDYNPEYLQKESWTNIFSKITKKNKTKNTDYVKRF